MRDLFNFLVRYSSWFIFLIYFIISGFLLISSGPYQRHVWMTSAGSVASWVYDGSHNVTSYFHLRDINEDLQQRNGELEREIAGLRSQVRLLSEKVYADTMTVPSVFEPFDFIIASVTSNSIALPHNYITLNKGSEDGIEPEMGVVDQNGVVGVVNLVSPHHSRVISMLNPDFRLSCKVKGNEAFGSLVWDGKEVDEAVLEELPKHTVYTDGDTIVTSGYSAVFPEGIPVGIVNGTLRDEDDNFFKLRIKLFTDFTRLSTVRVVVNNDLDDIVVLEKGSER
ncbi:MAG: rod shape-determining protein MreC [Muribaculaceae bacterium]|nr:rod shape-determining protein MreC [Muribaculaceae bacterium]